MKLRIGIAFFVCSLAAAAEDPGWLPPPEGEISRVAFGSCVSQGYPQDVWDAVRGARPDLFLMLGDNVYADAAPPGDRYIPAGIDVIAKMRMDYLFLYTQPQFAALRAEVPVLGTWDDHDYGRGDGGRDFARRHESREEFFDFFQVPQGDARRSTGGVYTAHVAGPPGRRVQVILLDTRSFRDPLIRRPGSPDASDYTAGRYVPHTDTTTTLLGQAQWEWLATQLRTPAEVRLIVSSIQVVADEKGFEDWGNFPHERRRLFDLIDDTGASGVVFLSGDVHYSEASVTDEGPYPLYDFTATPLAQKVIGWEVHPNSRRVSTETMFAERNFGLIEVEWARDEGPLVTYSAMSVDGERAYEVRLPLGDLR